MRDGGNSGAERGRHTVSCKLCGKGIERGYILRPDLCFNCDFWTEVSERSERRRRVIVDGECYSIGTLTTATNSQWRGYGGRRFVIQFEDGETVETVDLARKGTVPEHFREDLPDNAKFVEHVPHTHPGLAA
jgi:hypothetical protein